MKRKIISTLLCVSMCAALMMGCGQSDKSDTKENKKTEEYITGSWTLVWMLIL